MISYPTRKAANEKTKSGHCGIVSRMGGKVMIMDWLLSCFPAKEKYDLFADVFCGGMSVAISNTGRHITLINDMDSELMNLYTVLRDADKSKILAEQLYLTLYSRDEFNNALVKNPEDSDIEKARKFIVASRQSIYAGCHSWMSMVTKAPEKQGSRIATQFSYLPSIMLEFTDKIKGFQIENKPFQFILNKYDSDKSFFYCDPPYMKSGQISKVDYYDHIMTEADHIELIELCKTRKGMVAISGLKTDLYMDLLKDWKLITYEHRVESSGGLKKGKTNNNTMVDCLWTNYEPMKPKNDLFNA